MKTKEYGNIQDLVIYNIKSHVISKNFTHHSCTINQSRSEIIVKINSNIDLTFWHITFMQILIFTEKSILNIFDVSGSNGFQL